MWNDVAVLYPWNASFGKSIALDLKNDTTYGILLKKEKNILVDEIYRLFEKSAVEEYSEGKRYETKHSKSFIDDALRKKHFFYLANLGFLSLLITIMIHAALTLRVPIATVVIAGLLFSGVLFAFDVSVWLKYRRYINRVILSLALVENRIIWQNLSGNKYDMEIRDINKYQLDKIGGYMKFKDGSKLGDLEKLYYWPVLRERLLSKLKQFE